MTVIVQRGFLGVDARKRVVTVYYNGNMGATEADAKAEFEALYGKGAWIKLKAMVKDWKKDGFDYAWYVNAPKDAFTEAFL